jgi:squalene-hopene/tetraprenyl-beta-curcumene cyclase
MFMPGSRLFAIALVFGSLPVWCQGWNPRLAAQYLDSRQQAWSDWGAAKATGGTCFSCHTGMTYMLARPALRRALGETEPTAHESAVLNGLRVRLEHEDPKEVFRKWAKEPRFSQAISVDAIYSALFLARDEEGSAALSPQAQHAFDRMWSLQLKEGPATGGWAWFEFNLDPWETKESAYYGAVIAAMATGSAPPRYQNLPETRSRVAMLSAYLKKAMPAQPLHNRLMLLWAAAKLPAILEPADRKALLAEIWRKQQPGGSWKMEALGPWTEHAGAPQKIGNDNYSTAVVTFVLEQSGTPQSDPKLARAIIWLKTRQNHEFGYWDAESMNKRYEPGSMESQFMRDAATAFASLALIDPAKPVPSTTANLR